MGYVPHFYKTWQKDLAANFHICSSRWFFVIYCQDFQGNGFCKSVKKHNFRCMTQEHSFLSYLNFRLIPSRPEVYIPGCKGTSSNDVVCVIFDQTYNRSDGSAFPIHLSTSWSAGLAEQIGQPAHSSWFRWNRGFGPNWIFITTQYWTLYIKKMLYVFTLLQV